MKILLADDNAVSRRLLQRTLERSGFEVVCVADGVHAMECLLAPDGPRMAILDWIMPGKDGPTVCREIRATSKQPYLYLILLTSREASEDIVIGLEAGADDYLIKPCNPQEMKARVRAGQRILKLQDKLIHEARHDALTELPNRSFFSLRLADSVRRAKEQKNYQFAVLFVDIDRFKAVNDSLGHLSGDELMKGVAKRLLQAVRVERVRARSGSRHAGESPSDVVARVGGDEFVILLEDFADAQSGIRVAERIQTLLEPAFRIGGEDVFITASVGISASGGESIEASDILRNADAAMYKAKALGKARYEVRDPFERTAPVDMFRLEHDLRKAIERQEFEVYYQPIVTLADCTIRSFEALVRWHHPTLGLVLPGSFIPIAEETGLIVPLGAWIMHEACRQMCEWNARFSEMPQMAVSVNISPRQFGQQNLVASVVKVLHETGLEAGNIELEVTENLTMQDAERAKGVLRELSGLGVSLSLDDFGTGYSSLGYLRKFPIHTLKIDRSFITEIEHDRESGGIVKTIIALGRTLGLTVIAEGIENVAQLQFLKNHGCHLGQGYLFSPPVNAADALAILTSRALGRTFAPSDCHPGRHRLQLQKGNAPRSSPIVKSSKSPAAAIALKVKFP